MDFFQGPRIPFFNPFHGTVSKYFKILLKIYYRIFKILNIFFIILELFEGLPSWLKTP